ncbi:MAG: RIP metalloprotease RseP [Deltaproteobacteria bacterium]|nr:MAG: RIP metalloprotease RseP [Deltaproteobacteria bacterium]
MTTVLATIIVLGVLIFIHELGHFLLAKACGVRVDAFSLGFPPRLLHKQIGETDYRLSVIPLGGYVKLLGENPHDEVPPELEHRSFAHQTLWRRFLIVLAGPGFNFLFAVLALFLVFAFTGIPYLTTEIGGVTEDSPAARAGLQKGDLVQAIDGTKIGRWEELSPKIKERGEQPVTLEVKRGEKVFQVTVTPQRQEITDDFGGKVSTVLIGIRASEAFAVEEVNPAQAFAKGATASVRIAALTLESIYKLLAREIPIKTLGGPIFIAQIAGKQAEAGVSYLIHFMAALSVNLAMLNLLPIPVLDGGHLFFFAWEAVRGKPVAVKHREMAQAVGMMLILALMALVFYQDILRLLSHK